MVKAVIALAIFFAAFFSCPTWAGSQGLKWTELSTLQKQALAPLAGEWDTFPESQRKKLLNLASRYPSLNPEQQHRLQSRLQDWSKLTPEQRNLARKNYQDFMQLPPEKRMEVKHKLKQMNEAKQANVQPQPTLEGAAATAQ